MPSCRPQDNWSLAETEAPNILPESNSHILPAQVQLPSVPVWVSTAYLVACPSAEHAARNVYFRCSYAVCLVCVFKYITWCTMQDGPRLLTASVPDVTVSHQSTSGTISATVEALPHQSAPLALTEAHISSQPLDSAAAQPAGWPGVSADKVWTAPGLTADGAAALKRVSAEQGLLLQARHQPSLASPYRASSRVFVPDRGLPLQSVSPTSGVSCNERQWL